MGFLPFHCYKSLEMFSKCLYYGYVIQLRKGGEGKRLVYSVL